MIYIIEHLEPKLWNWCKVEYKNISQTVGKDNLWFTNIKDGGKFLEKFGKVFSASVKEMNLKNVCILDPDSKETLTTKDTKKFDYLIFGGILGDYPPKKRTKKELTKFMEGETRNIGKKQMATNNAVYVVHQIALGKKMSDLKFQQNLEIPTGKFESIILPYKYVLVEGKPLICKETIKYLKNKKEF